MYLTSDIIVFNANRVDLDRKPRPETTSHLRKKSKKRIDRYK